MFRELWDAFCDWAKEAWNWLHKFFRKAWDFIVSWWEAIGEIIEEWLENLYTEVVVVDEPSSIFDDIYERIKKECSKTTSVKSFRKKKIALNFDTKTGTLRKVSEFDTNNVQEEDEFERQLRGNGGILRITA